ncbi:NnrU family protein [Halorhodospira halophila]|uniref:NnrUfamily protein n=1 Tax=Halorhodospira halophila (strain DSM 244 / SL1) TaxID=349124 RepID=A1WT38_HALHL|nr:NnrU family protein [Halorhodospira halophila]ABM60850.1 NnrUfamily protein [Halorhodospira halophila SL1]MBK1728504.1 NnrU family protein [Halorhodospira halophila]
MLILLLGLILFLGTHSVRVVADDWRSNQIAAYGEIPWKTAYSALSLVGLIIAIYGYGLTRVDAVWVWMPPNWTAHLMALVMIPAFILLFSAYGPANRIRNAVGHPMLLAVALWALAHLMANGRLGDLVFFGAFLAWASVTFVAARERDRRQAASPTPAQRWGNAWAIGGGLIGYIVFALFLHIPITGVPAYAS